MTTLKELRQARSLTRAKVAADFDLSERHIYRLENGVTPLRKHLALAFARYYGVDLAEIWKDEAA